MSKRVTVTPQKAGSRVIEKPKDKPTPKEEKKDADKA